VSRATEGPKTFDVCDGDDGDDGDGDGDGDLSDCDDDEGDEEDYDMTSQLYCCFVISHVNTHVQRHTSCVTSHKSHVARDTS